ncbi:MAG: hypothetical protein MMC23_004506 [Stictis urceolatum]|nr:hypothetical protein [Stictis urceolata]
MSSPVLLLFGSGANVGLSTARKFSSEGYKVAAVSRHPSDELKKVADLTIAADLSDPTSVEGVFEKTINELGHPHAVVYNGTSLFPLIVSPAPLAYDAHFVPASNPLSIPLAHFASNLAVNTTSAYAAACLSVKSFSTLPASASRTFMYTGNMQNTLLYPESHSLGVGKNASAYFIEMASHAYGPKGYKFYYVDERNEAGESVMGDIDGEAHGEVFLELSRMPEQGAWDWTFVKGKGYVRNKGVVDREVRVMGLEGVPEGGWTYKELLGMMAQKQ